MDEKNRMTTMDMIGASAPIISRIALPGLAGAQAFKLFVKAKDYHKCLEETLPNCVVDNKMEPEAIVQAMAERQSDVDLEVKKVIDSLKEASENIHDALSAMHEWFVTLSVLSSVSAYIHALHGEAAEKFFSERLTDWSEQKVTVKYAMYDLYGLLHREEILDALLNVVLGINEKDPDILDFKEGLGKVINASSDEDEGLARALEYATLYSGSDIPKGKLFLYAAYVLWRGCLHQQEQHWHRRKVIDMLSDIFANLGSLTSDTETPDAEMASTKESLDPSLIN